MSSADNLNANSLDPNQARQNVTLIVFLKEYLEKDDYEKNQQMTKKACIFFNYPEGRVNYIFGQIKHLATD